MLTDVVELVATGTAFVPDEQVVAPDEAPKTPIVLEKGIGELPHGYMYAAAQGATRLQLTFYESALWVQEDVRALLLHELELVRGREHKYLLPLLGTLDTEWGVVAVRLHPERLSLRRFIERRIQRNKPVSADAAAAMGTQLCEAVSVLHPDAIHGYITPDTVYLGKDGRLLLGAAGEGRALPYASGFDRFRAAGLLTMAAPEILEDPPRYLEATDVYGIAATVVEVLSGRPLPMPGASLRSLGLPAPPEMLDVLEHAIAPDPRDRWPSVGEFSAYLSQWGRRKKALTPVSGAVALPTPDPYAPQPIGPQDSLVPPPPAFSSGAFGVEPPPQRPASLPDAPDFERLSLDATPPEDEGVPSARPLRGTPPPPPPPPPPAPPKRAAGRPPSPPPPPGRVPPKVEKSPGVASKDWSALDMATRRILDDDGPAESLTHGVGDDYRPRPAAPNPSGRDELEDLGLALERFDDAADRLSTIDGQSGLIGLTDLDGRGRSDDPPAHDRGGLQAYAAQASTQGYFGSLATDDDVASRPTEALGSSLVVEDDPGAVANRDRKARVWVLTRDGVDQAARSLEQLEALANRGELVSTDRVSEDGARRILAVDVPELRAIFERKANPGRARPTGPTGEDGPLRLDRDRVPGLGAAARGMNMPSAATPAPSRGPAASGRAGNSALGTVMWIVVALAVFAAATWILWQRTQGG